MSTSPTSPAPAENQSSRLKSIFNLKVVAGISSVLALFFALNQFTGIIQNLRVHHADFNESMKMGDQQLQRGENSAAFESFKHASSLDPIDRTAQARQVKAAMLWLEDAHSAQTPFKTLADTVQPVLERALTRAKGSQAGDIAAHVGWAAFLRQRETGAGDESIEASYQQALALDPQNPYAHAMFGHWILWNHGSPADAQKHFAAALSSGRARPFVRTLQLAAFLNTHNSEVELLRIADDMRRSGDTISPDERRRVFEETIMLNLHNTEGLGHIATAVSANDLPAVYDWLSEGYDSGENAPQRSWRRSFILAIQAEASGDKPLALSRFKSLQAELQSTHAKFPGRVLDDMVTDSIKRISKSTAK